MTDSRGKRHECHLSRTSSSARCCWGSQRLTPRHKAQAHAHHDQGNSKFACVEMAVDMHKHRLRDSNDLSVRAGTPWEIGHILVADERLTSVARHQWGRSIAV